MSYLVLARKYRPSDFSSLSGQEHVRRTLINAIKREKIGHAYLFAGPRGVGKTSVARIFAKALNCSDGPTETPCLKCHNCIDITEGRSLAVREIDGASHNSVDHVRELIESFRSLPPAGSRFKIYIIDEVHMLSIAAFNALLKSLEEPPPNTVFILATTELHKIPETVVSRCQKHEFRAIGANDIELRLIEIAKREGIEFEGGAIKLISRLADGSMRDAQSLLDRVHSFCDGKITAADASQVLGVASRSAMFDITQAIFAHDSTKALEVLSGVFSTGVNPSLFLSEFVSHWREILLAKAGGVDALKRIGALEDDIVELKRQAESLSFHDLNDLVILAHEGADRALRSSHPKYATEALVVRLALRESVKDIGGMITTVEKLFTASSAPAASFERKNNPENRTMKAQTEIPKPLASNIDKTVSAQTTGRNLDWGMFVQHVVSKGGGLIAEHLKRLSIVSFMEGALDSKGPAFSVKYLKDPERIQKLKGYLVAFSGYEQWKVKIEEGDNAISSAPLSIRGAEEHERDKRRAEQTQGVLNHPKLKSLQEIFPGSEIEEIKLKE